ncbi:MAG: uracil phosphoribosyltransferase [Candidatus Schekmanbacteria bacterium]|nr:uracil phosphoribosyltransferase [Candidatus Schekmanbacteria bacterium]
MVVQHPLAALELARMRDKTATQREFREALAKLSSYLIYEHLRADVAQPLAVNTPLGVSTAQVLDSRHLVFVGILRAGLAMVAAAMQLVPDVPVGLFGARRDETTLCPEHYYTNFPPVRGRRVIVLDPMLATGGSMISCLDYLAAESVAGVSAVCAIAAPEGIARVHERYPDVRLTVGAVDAHLNQNGYIVPGLGDAGDRYFGT